MIAARCSPAGCWMCSQTKTCPLPGFVITGCDSRSSAGAPLLSLLCLLALSGPQLVCHGETPAQSPEHEQYGHAVKGAVPFKRAEACSRHGHCAETKPLALVCSTASLRFPTVSLHWKLSADVQDSR